MSSKVELPAQISYYVTQLKDKKVPVFQRQEYAWHLKDISTAINKVLAEYSLEFNTADESLRKKKK